MPRNALPSGETPSLFVGDPDRAGSDEGMEDRMRRAEAQLVRLQREREQLELERRRLEELGDRQRSFAEGRARVCRRLAEAIPHIHEAVAAAQRDAESCSRLAKIFQNHLHALKEYHPEEWVEQDLGEEVVEAERALRDAEEQLGAAKMRGRTGQARPDAREGGSFGFWLKAGLAFSLPFMLFLAAVAAALYYVWER